MTSTPQHTPIWLRRFALATVGATFILIIAGGIVTTRDAGLAVPDWPLSYGQLMPERWYAIANIAAEHGHRMIAGTVALMTLALAVCFARFEPRRWVRRLAWIALAVVIAQALLGGATVLILGDIRAAIRVGHTILAQSFFMLVMLLAAATSAWWRDAGKHRFPAPEAATDEPLTRESAHTNRALLPAQTRQPFLSLKHAALIAAAVVFAQLLLGAVMRHTESGRALTEFPTAHAGSLIPPTTAAGLSELNESRWLDHELPTAVTMTQVWFNFTHRAFAIIVSLAVIALAVHVLRFNPGEPLLVLPAVALVGLLAAQIVLGALTVLSLRHVWITTFHVATGVFMFATAYMLTVRAYRLDVHAGALIAEPRFAAIGRSLESHENSSSPTRSHSLNASTTHDTREVVPSKAAGATHS